MVASTRQQPWANSYEPEAVEAWLARLAGHRSQAQLERLRQAVQAAHRLHADERSLDDLPRVQALLLTADQLDRLKLDLDSLVAGLLSEAPASPLFDAPALAEDFGAAVVSLVEQTARLRELSAATVRRNTEEGLENLRRMLLGISADVRALLIVLVKRLRLMRGLKRLPREEQIAFAEETRAVHAPLANRLGIWQVKWELEDLSLRFLEPEAYKTLARQLDDRRPEREAFIAGVLQRLEAECQAHGIQGEISGRPKHIYSIWRKMERKRVDFDRIFDVRAVRVLVDTVPECYEVLGMVHGLWRPIPGEFDDYIARPKPNGYSSLHTAVVGEDGKPLEVQIRTREMHEHAERGVAAHWVYKESGSADADLERRIRWMRRLLEQQDDGADTDDDGADEEGFEARQIYVLTPQSQVIELPRGATPVDFAYAIHSSVGHRCRGAKVDGRIVTLTQPLQSGQTVEILTVKEGGPSRDWLNPHSGYLVTGRARNRIRQWFNHQDYEQHVQLGRAALDREIARLSLPRPNLDKLAPRFNARQVDDLLAAIGRGDLSPFQVANAPADTPARTAPPPSEQAPLLRRPRRSRPPSGGSQVSVAGVDDLLTSMAKCCKPVPYDRIVGYITQGRGVTVHRANCAFIRQLPEAQQDRLLDVAWSGAADAAGGYQVDIKLYALDRKGLLRDISAVFANAEVGVLGVNTQTDRRHERASMQFAVEVTDMTQLSRILEQLSQVPDVLDVRRLA